MTAPRDAAAGRLASWIGPGLLLAIGGALLAWTWRGWPDPVIDFGRELYVPWQLTEGAALFRDIAWFNGPLSPCFNALLFRLFGASLTTLVTANLVLLAGTVALLYRLLVRLSDRVAATAACLVFLAVFAFGQLVGTGNFNWVCPYSHELTHGLFLALLSVAGLERWMRTGDPLSLTGAGLALGLCFLTKPEPGLAGGAAAAVLLAPAATRRDVRGLSLFAGAALLPIVVTGALLSLHLTPTEAIRGTLGAWPSLFSPEVASLPFYRSGLGLDRPGPRLVEALTWAGGWLLVLGPASALALVRRRSPAAGRWLALAGAAYVVTVLAFVRGDLVWTRTARPLAVFALATGVGLFLAVRRAPQDQRPRWLVALAFTVLSFVMLAKMILHVRVIHYGFALAPLAAMLVTVALVSWLPARLDRAGAHGVVLRVAALVFLAWGAAEHLIVSKGYLSRKTNTVAEGPDAFRADLRGLFVDDALGILEILEPRTLAVFPEGIMINYLARVPNPTPYVNFLPPEMLLFGEERWLAAFRANPPDVVLVAHRNTSEYGYRFFGRDYAQDLARWIGTSYEPVKLLGDEPLLPDSRYGIRVLVRRRTP